MRELLLAEEHGMYTVYMYVLQPLQRSREGAVRPMQVNIANAVPFQRKCVM